MLSSGGAASAATATEAASNPSEANLVRPVSVCPSPVRSARPAKTGSSFELPTGPPVCESPVSCGVEPFPVGVGSPIQTDQTTLIDGSAFVSREALGDANDRNGSSKTFFCVSKGEPPERGAGGLVSRFLRLVSLASSAPVRCRQQQQQQPQQRQHAEEEPFYNAGAEPHVAVKREGSVCELQPAKGMMQTKRVLQWASDGHRRALEMYGGPIEDIIRLALQVLPAQATDHLSERRLLLLQAVVDVFCLYRAHFLSPPDALVQAEALQRQGRVLAGKYQGPQSSFGAPGVSPDVALSLCSDAGVGEPGKEGGAAGGLPLSVRSAVYWSASLALEIVRALQLLLEVHALRRKGNSHRLGLCLRLEILKLALKMLLRAVTPFGFYCDEQSVAQAFASQKSREMAAERATLQPHRGRRTGRQIPPLLSSKLRAEDPRAQLPPADVPPLPPGWAMLFVLWLLKELKAYLSWDGLCGLLRSKNWRLALGEFLYHLRPFVHLYLLKRARSSKSWAPWLVAFCVEAHSVWLLHESAEAAEGLSVIEAAELRRRLVGLRYALLRPPFFDKFLVRPFETIDFFLRRVPLLNHLNVLDAFLAYRGMYFTTSNT